MIGVPAAEQNLSCPTRSYPPSPESSLSRGVTQCIAQGGHVWPDDCGKDRFEAVVGLLHPGGEVLAVGREERVSRAVAAPTSAARELDEVVPLAGVAAFGAGPVVVRQTPFLGAAGKSRMKTERCSARDGDGAVRAGRLVVRVRAFARAGADVFAPSPGGTV